MTSCKLSKKLWVESAMASITDGRITSENIIAVVAMLEDRLTP